MSKIKHLNKVELIGNIGKEPEVKTYGNTSVTRFSLATQSNYKDKTTGEWVNKADWHNIEVWNFDNPGLLAKGKTIKIEGKIKYNVSEKDGRTYTNILALNISDPEENKSNELPEENDIVSSDLPTDDLPF